MIPSYNRGQQLGHGLLGSCQQHSRPNHQSMFIKSHSQRQVKATDDQVRNYWLPLNRFFVEMCKWSEFQAFGRNWVDTTGRGTWHERDGGSGCCGSGKNLRFWRCLRRQLLSGKVTILAFRIRTGLIGLEANIFFKWSFYLRLSDTDHTISITNIKWFKQTNWATCTLQSNVSFPIHFALLMQKQLF